MSGTVSLTPPAIRFEDRAPRNLDNILASAGNYKIADHAETKWVATYYPLLLIIAFISAVSFRGALSLHDWMLNFMAGFFIVFSFFKLLNLRGFKEAYAGYDLLAKFAPGYGYIYPFIELALGAAFLFRLELQAALLISAALMLFGSIGVMQALRRRQAIRCACLGTVLNLPMSTLTLVEDLGMAAMSAVMLAGYGA
ncbi:MAG TPA: MauE/DoxX family redox-associated membrane protein [Patescibacteria group bacterium]|nr:MauE/DoxX family redox-associated membrane protein [Patescibacteria group bacterium]